MRLRRLDLLRYGHFTDRSIDLPAGERDLHVVFGPNEAGKSTALAAIEDLLFGIAMQSAFNFLHDYRDMRIGGVLESDAGTLAFVRRKGAKDTVLGPDEVALPEGEGALHPFLKGADRAFFERMFSLDHTRLERGGREILDARDEIGQMLFSAGAGIAGLRGRLLGLEDEADQLWGPRRAGRRRYTQAADRLEQAERDLREQTVTAGQWEEKRAASEVAERAHAALEAEFVRQQSEGRRLARIRRVHRDLRRKAELDARIDALGPVAPLPADAERQLAQAERQLLETSTRLDTLGQRLQQAREEFAGLHADTGLLRRAEDIQLLHERRIEVRRARSDLPKRQLELQAAESRLLALARELGWTVAAVDEVIAAVPTRAKIALARSVLAERGERRSRTDAAQQAVADSRKRRQRVQARLEAIPSVPDQAPLAAAVASVRAQGDVAARLQLTEAEVAQARRQVERLHAVLCPALPSPEAVIGLPVPVRADVQRLRDRILDQEQRERALRDQIEDAGEELLRARETWEQAARREGGVTAEELAEARRYRDELWELIERRHLRAEPLDAAQAERFADFLRHPAEHYRTALRAADEIADRRFEQAETLGRLDQLARTAEAREAAVEALVRRRDQAADGSRQLGLAWRALWQGMPFEPLSPDAMLVWLDTRAELLQAFEVQAAAADRFAAVREDERRSREHLLSTLAALGADGAESADLEAQPLSFVLQRASDLLQAYEQGERERRTLAQELRVTEDECERVEGELTRAESEWGDWEQRWVSVVASLGLVPEADPVEITRQVEIIESLHGLVQEIRGLRHDRIDKIRADIAAFERAVAALLQDIGPELLGADADEALLEIERRLAVAQEVHQRQHDRQLLIRNLETDIAREEERLREARGSLARLMEMAAADSVEALHDAIARAGTARQLRAELDGILHALEQAGDGLPVAELEVECAGVDLDEAAAREQALGRQLTELRGRLDAAVEARTHARESFRAIGGDAAAARVAAVRQEALAEMRAAAERYVRVRTAAVLLRWAIDRYRREKQAPLLRRAGAIFKTLTGGAFSALRVDFDDRDQPHLTGVRGNGGTVPVPGLSTGTADQLFLALRLASIEDYLGNAPGLPFVADDLFVNFDDRRSAAGFEVLGELATRTQVLFFTHHRHLVDVAQERLGADLHVVFLGAG